MSILGSPLPQIGNALPPSMSDIELCWMMRLSLSGHRWGGGPAYQESIWETAPLCNASACRMTLCDIETPNPTVGGAGSLEGVASLEDAASLQGAAPAPIAIPEALQSVPQSYSPSTRFARMSRND